MSDSSSSDGEHPEDAPYPIPPAGPAENGGSEHSPPSGTSAQSEEGGGSQNPVFDEDSDIYDNDDEPVVKKKRSKNREYKVTQLFEDRLEFDAWWQHEKHKWRVADRHCTKGADTDFFRCQFGKRAKYNCPKMLRVDYSAEDESVIVGESVGEHDDEPIEPSALSEATKKAILELSKAGLQPMRILNALRNRNTNPLPSLLQVQNVVKRATSKDTAKTFKVHDLTAYCEENHHIPPDDNEAYVLRYRIESATKFGVVWTTKALLKAQLESKLLQLDSTCKTNWYGYPVQVAGFSDADHRFHATLYAVSHSEDTWSYQMILEALKHRNYYPEVILADGAAEITAACRGTFPQARRAMCWSHMIRQCDKRLAAFPKELKQRLRSDIKLLQYARSDREFEFMARSLLDSWPEETEEFRNYVRSVWIDSALCYWYEGATQHCSTNNGLESANKQIKESHTLRRLLRFPLFLKISHQIVRGWSVTSTDEKPPVSKPTVKPHVFCDAYALSKSGRIWRKANGADRYVFAAGDSNITTKEDLAAAFDEWDSECGSFTEFSARRFKVHVVTKHPDGPFYQCSCYVGAKKHPCKHSVMVECLPQVGLRTYPPDATSEQLVRRKKVGRPSGSGRPRPSEEENRASSSGRPRLAEVQNRHAVAH